MTNDTVLRWADGYVARPLPEQLRTRPNVWAVIGDNLPDMAAGIAARELSSRLGGLADGFEVELLPYDDGPYGVLYELRARYCTHCAEEG